MSCLFQSLSSFITHHDYIKLRQDICDFLLENPKLIEGMDMKTILDLDGLTLENYTSHMRSNSTWGGAIEIKAFCELYKVNILVKNIRRTDEEKDIQFICASEETDKWIVISWNGGHFEPVIIEIPEEYNP